MTETLPWIERTPNPRAAKIGTIPCLVQVHGGDVRRIEPGATVRIREREGGTWTRVRVGRADTRTGWFQADR